MFSTILKVFGRLFPKADEVFVQPSIMTAPETSPPVVPVAEPAPAEKKTEPTPKVHDYRFHYWGHTIFHTSVIDGGKQFRGGGFGSRYVISVGDCVDTPLPGFKGILRLRISEIRWESDPYDSFWATFEYVCNVEYSDGRSIMPS